MYQNSEILHNINPVTNVKSPHNSSCDKINCLIFPLHFIDFMMYCR